MNVLDEIVINKRKIINESEKSISKDELKKEAYDYRSTIDSKYRFQEVLKNKLQTKLICEYKPASPSKGDISNLSIEDVIEIYDESPVDMISVLTEESYFKSNLNNLIKATKYTDKAILRKDFIIDEYMIYESALNDASCVLLIEGICPDIEKYLNITYELGLDAIVECHSIEDIKNIEKFNPPIVGVNNRNLNDFSINLETTKKLKEYVPKYLISESGVDSIDDAKLLQSYGADAILIGTSVLKKNYPDEIKSYINDLHNSLK